MAYSSEQIARALAAEQKCSVFVFPGNGNPGSREKEKVLPSPFLFDYLLVLISVIYSGGFCMDRIFLSDADLRFSA